MRETKESLDAPAKKIKQKSNMMGSGGHKSPTMTGGNETPVRS